MAWVIADTATQSVADGIGPEYLAAGGRNVWTTDDKLAERFETHERAYAIASAVQHFTGGALAIVWRY